MTFYCTFDERALLFINFYLSRFQEGIFFIMTIVSKVSPGGELFQRSFFRAEWSECPVENDRCWSATRVGGEWNSTGQSALQQLLSISIPSQSWSESGAAFCRNPTRSWTSWKNSKPGFLQNRRHRRRQRLDSWRRQTFCHLRHCYICVMALLRVRNDTVVLKRWHCWVEVISRLSLWNGADVSNKSHNFAELCQS